MPAVVDSVVHHVGELCKAALNAYAAGMCGSVAECEPFEGAPNVSFPCLSLWRESESPEAQGTGNKRTRMVTLKAIYELGPKGVTNLESATAVNALAVQVIDSVLEDEKHASYESGKSLYELCGVTGLGMTEARYQGGHENYPHVVLTIKCEHEYTRAPLTSAALTEFLGSLNRDLDLAATAFEYDTGKHIALTPLRTGVLVDYLGGGALAVAVSGLNVTLTVVGGTTTVAALAAAVAAHADAKWLLTVSGDAGTIPAPVESLSLALSRPAARQSSDTT